MKDYSKKIEQLSFLKHYLILEDKIEAKYSKDELSSYPLSEHNIELLNKKLSEQLNVINDKYVQELKIKSQILMNCLCINLLFNGLYTPDSVRISLQNDNFFLAMVACIIGGGSFSMLLYRFIKVVQEMQEIKDMNYVEKELKDVIIDLEGINLSKRAEEQLQIDDCITLNNVECFTHQDIQKIKRNRENKKY